MNQFYIRGLDSKKNLHGTVEISGAKNAVLKAMAASVLFGDTVTLKNVPDTADVHTLQSILEKLGMKVVWKDEGKSKSMTIDPRNIITTKIDAKLACSMRASVVLTGPLLARFKNVDFPMPGGCVIGARPIDLFLSGYKQMGATVNESKDFYSISAPNGLDKTEITFTKKSVGATETLMMASVLSDGKTVLKNCAMEPEIVSVAEWLNSCGANIIGAGTEEIIIEGTKGKLLSPSFSYETIPDRIEAGSYLILGSLCAEELIIDNCIPKHLDSVIEILQSCGVSIKIEENRIIVNKNQVANNTFKSPGKIITREYPGFPTDLQPIITVFLTQISGECNVIENIYEGRFKYVEDLINLGADIQMVNNLEIKIEGPTPLKIKNNIDSFKVHDIRAGFAIVLAALIAKGDFKISNIGLIDRGYERLEEKLKSIGVQIERK